jgi:hypothetical protein
MIVEYAGDDTSEERVVQDNIKEFESTTALYISYVNSCLKSLPFVHHPNFPNRTNNTQQTPSSEKKESFIYS